MKKYFTIGCCGIDCGLCPRFHTSASSACPGCGGLNFREKHPSCGFLTCCFIKKGLEVCSECPQYPCKRFDAERAGYDSFVTHRKIFSNHDFIKSNGIERFIEDQQKKISILSGLLQNFDDGRSKSFFCLSCALLPQEKMMELKETMENPVEFDDIKDRNKRIRDKLMEIAKSRDIDLKLLRKK